MSVDAKDLTTKQLVARLGLRVFIIIALGVFFGCLLGPTMNFLGPFIWAYIITAICLFPILKRLSKKLVKFWSVVLVVLMLLIILLIVGGIVFYIITEVLDIVKNWDHYKETITQAIDKISEYVGNHTSMKAEKVHDTLYNLGDKVIDFARNDLFASKGYVMHKAGQLLPAIGSFLLAFLFFIMATYFMCAEYTNINSGIKKLIPNAIKPQLRTMKNCAGRAAFGYLKAQVIISSLVALIAFVVFLIIGQSYSLVWAILVGLIDFVPMLGSSVILVPWIVILVAMGDINKAIIFACLTFVLFMFRRIIEPKMVGSQTGLHPLLALVALYIGIKVGGLIGMIFAPIVLMMIVNLYKAGFFTPTIRDVKEAFYRVAVFSGMNTEDDGSSACEDKKDNE